MLPVDCYGPNLLWQFTTTQAFGGVARAGLTFGIATGLKATTASGGRKTEILCSNPWLDMVDV